MELFSVGLLYKIFSLMKNFIVGILTEMLPRKKFSQIWPPTRTGIFTNFISSILNARFRKMTVDGLMNISRSDGNWVWFQIPTQQAWKGFSAINSHHASFNLFSWSHSSYQWNVLHEVGQIRPFSAITIVKRRNISKNVRFCIGFSVHFMTFSHFGKVLTDIFQFSKEKPRSFLT